MPDQTTRHKILDAAARLFASTGYSAVSIRDVAMIVKVTPANLYYHFKDKEELIRETLAHVFTEKMLPMEPLLNQSAPADKRLEIFVTWFTRLVFEDEIFTRLLCRELLDGDRTRLEHLSQTVFEKPFALLASVTVFDAARTDPALSAVSLVSIILGHCQLAGALPYLPGGQIRHTDPEVVSRHVLSLLHSVLKKHTP